MAVDTALDIIRAAAGHELLGEYAFRDAVFTGGGSTTLFSDADLQTFAGDSRYQNYRLFVWNGAAGGNERYVYSRNGALGQMQVLQPLSAAPARGDGYLLFRDFGWSDLSGNVNWLQLLNQTLRSLYFDGEAYVQGITDLLKYSLPTPVSYGGWVDEVRVGPYPFRWTDEFPAPVTWYRLNPLNVQGDTYLVLDASLDSSAQLVFLFSRPYVHPHLSAYTMSRSVLTPFGETTAISPPRNLVVAGMVWRALKAKVRTLTGDARQQWLGNLKEAAQLYAEECSRNGLRRIGSQDVGYGEVW